MTQCFRSALGMQAGYWVAVALACGAFAAKDWGLIEAISPWSNELLSGGKSFQADYAFLLVMLRQNPILFYYSLR